MKAAGTSAGSLRTRASWSGCAAKRATMLPIAATVRVDAGAEVLVDDVAGRARGDVAAGLGVEDAAAHRAGGEVVGGDLASTSRRARRRSGSSRRCAG